ncbi:MAG: FadR/GntR family transcriptional regulator [Pirellulales bacterium]
MLQTLGRAKIRDVVATRLKSYIVDAGLKPGDRLPTETELAAQFGVNRLSLREATKALEFLGIVEARPGRGLTVGRMDMQRVTEHLSFHPALHDISPAELIDTRVVIEVGVLPIVAQRMRRDAAIEPALRAVNDQLRQARTLQRFVELDIVFHRELIVASGLSSLTAFCDVLEVFCQRFRESVKKAEWRRGIEHHDRILDALAAGQIRAAQRQLRSHIESHRTRFNVTQ